MMWYIFEKEIVQRPQKQCFQVKNKNLEKIENQENLENLKNLENQENQKKLGLGMPPLFFPSSQTPPVSLKKTKKTKKT